MPAKRKIKDIDQEKLRLDSEAIQFLQLNAPYLSLHAMQRALRVTPEKLAALIVAAEVDVSPAMKEPRASDIADDIGFLPIGTAVEQWQRGTSIHLASNIEGVTRITRHYGLGDE